MRTIVPSATTKGGFGRSKTPLGLGDMVERLAHPIAVTLKLPCLDEKQELRAESPCARRREWLNKQGKKIGIGNTEKLKGTTI